MLRSLRTCAHGWLCSPHKAVLLPARLQVRSAWAIAQTLGRALIFPPIWAGLDRWWAPHDGKIPGSKLDLPYIAPFDHVMDLEGCVPW